MNHRVSENWFPVTTEYFNSAEAFRLRSAVGPEADVYPIRLWGWCFEHSTDGRVDPECVEEICRWRGEPGKLLGALQSERIGFIGSDGIVRGWTKWAGKFRARAIKKRQDTMDRKDRMKERKAERQRNAKGTRPERERHADGTRSGTDEERGENAFRNADGTHNKKKKDNKKENERGSAGALPDGAPPARADPPPASRSDSVPGHGPAAASGMSPSEAVALLSAVVRRTIAPKGSLVGEPDGPERSIWQQILDRRLPEERAQWVQELTDLMPAIAKSDRHKVGGVWPITSPAMLLEFLGEMLSKFGKPPAAPKNPAAIKREWITTRSEELLDQGVGKGVAASPTRCREMHAQATREWDERYATKPEVGGDP